MVEVKILVREIVLDKNNYSILPIKAIFNVQNSASIVLFKVKVSLKDVIEVRPSFGILHSKEQDKSMAMLNLKYSGDRSRVKELKIKVSWIVDSNKALDVINWKMTHHEFSEYYKSIIDKSKAIEKSQILSFSLEETKKKDDTLILGQKNQQSQQSFEENSTNLINSSNNKTQNSRELITVDNTSKSKTVSFKIVIITVIICFIVGIFLGVRVQSVLQQGPTSQQIVKEEVKSEVQSIIQENQQIDL